MARHILRCKECGRYTLEEKCPGCGKKTFEIKPPKYSPEDRYGAYRRKYKEQHPELKH